MKKSTANTNILRIGYFIVPLIVTFIVSSCNPTKYVPKGESLLNGNHIEINKEGVKKADLLPYIKQTPNKQIFGTRFYLGLYNLSNINKTRWPHKWLRDIGEEPVIFDPYAVTKTKEQIKSYVDSKGYFDGIVTDTVLTARMKSDVFYNIRLDRPYTIHNLTYEIADSNIRKLCFFDSVNCVIARGKPYDVDVLQAERIRFERFIRDHGFYGFSTDYISFKVDSTVGDRQIDIKYIIKNFSGIDSDNQVVNMPFAVYSVKNIYIYPDFEPREQLQQGEAYFEHMDTTLYNGYYFITSNKTPEIKYDLIIKSLFVRPHSVFNVTNTEETQSHLMGLKVYRLVNINYADSRENENPGGLQLDIDCNIQLTLLSQQTYRIELEGTNMGGNIGGDINFVYQHKNLFHGAELLSMKLKGAYSVYSTTDTVNKFKSVEEYGFETSLKFPKFILPFFKTESFIEKYNPSTTLVASFDYQSLPFYTRSVANASFGYDWTAGKAKNFEHIVTPLQVNLINMLSIQPEFEARIDSSSYQAFAYRDVLILGGSYSFIYNNHQIKNSKDYWFLRVNAETAGNLISLADIISGAKKTTSSSQPSGVDINDVKTFKVLGQPFAQYVRTDFDIRYYYKFNDVSSVAYRGFFGIGIPYGNSREIPFDRQYFEGGANGIRAWQVRTLGPGSYNPNPLHKPGVFLNETADIKLEANAEYRYKLFWILEGALFIDAGNIWSYNHDISRTGSQFTSKFYRDIAIGTGTGFRFDFKFVIARVDIGMKLRDPLLERGTSYLPPYQKPDASGPKWIFLNGPYRLNDFTIVVGIGYPF